MQNEAEDAPRSTRGGRNRRAASSPEALELAVETLAFGGEGIARVGGKVRFIPGALPGETVLAAPIQRRRQFDRMRLLQVLVASPERRPPLCSHTSVCGGCVLQTLEYGAQLRAKAQQVRDCLLRIGRMEVPEWGPPIASPTTTGYRNKMEYTFATRGWRTEGPPLELPPSLALGLHVPGRFDAVFDLADCVLPSASSVAALDAVRAFARTNGLSAWRSDEDRGLLRHLIVREGSNTGEILVGLVVREDDPVFDRLGPVLADRVPGLVGAVLVVNRSLASIARGDTERVLHGRPCLRERLQGIEFKLSVQSFFQTNTRGAEALVDAVREGMADRAGGQLLDLYCGAGTMALALAGAFTSVLGVEQAGSAVADARANAAANGITNARFIEAPVEAWLEGKGPEGTEPPQAPFHGGVLVDPPRSGLHPRAVKGLCGLSPSWILYVSCNPSTLARDAALLVEDGYRPVRLRIVDMFPHTAHVESVLLLERPAERP